ncbi:MAG: hypothetical protein KKF85_08445 [Gammaproteobacteria bacterium]|nr:hypothetical protein [Rhodocyclaceae bacterium]MBU3910228.1 hypothetical protein [Gammaproteobacteria bacterium]MBU3988814.1 hypothetical protein [Gammaproteobacteria bacterium]MBU4004473.1 hypothetical protein [Gammaproteobacteria bacterium]MBU4022690.1 hypothetical protein [Gammaproteobacteria bacterium]
MDQDITRGTSAHAPDLDWSQVRETVLMLELAAGQVEAAMKDSNNSVDVLADTFTSLVDTLQVIDAAISTLPDTIGNGLVKAEIQANSQLVSSKVHQAIVAFQFYDKLIQRLEHVCHGLAGLSELVADQQRLFKPAEWKALQDGILAKYTMAEERVMFQSVLAGATVKEALETYMAARLQDIRSHGGEIELF